MKILFVFLFFVISSFTFSQSTAGNLDFEDGDFGNWTTINGNVFAPAGHGAHPFVFSGYGVLFPSVYLFASHYIIDSQRNDIDISLVKALCPYTGSNSARLGDNNGGGEASRIEKIIQVGASDTILDFFYAFVAKISTKPIHEQPYFFYQLFDSSGGTLTQVDSVLVNPGSSILSVDTTATFGRWEYLDWTYKKIDLSSFVGKNVLIRITTGDCGYGGNTARSYVDFSMNPKKVYVTKSLCFSSDSIIYRGKTYTTMGVYSDTVWMGSTVDSVFTLFVREVDQKSILPVLSSRKDCSIGRYSIDCDVSSRGVDSTLFNWWINDSLIQSGMDSNLSYNISSLDTVYCEVTAYSYNCVYVEFSDTLFLNPYISNPSVNLIQFGSDLKAAASGGLPPYSYIWKLNFSTISHTDSIITPSVNGTYYVTVVDANGCESKDSIGYFSNLEEFEKVSNFNFYPNPAFNSIYVELNGEQGMIEIIDVQGKIVKSSAVKSDGQLNLENLEKGIYLMRFITEADKVITKKLLIE